MPNRTLRLLALSMLVLVGLLAIERHASAQPPLPVPPPGYWIPGPAAYAGSEAQGQQPAAKDATVSYPGVPAFVPYPPVPGSVYAFYPPRAYRWPAPRRIYAYRGYPVVFPPVPPVPAGIWPPYWSPTGEMTPWPTPPQPPVGFPQPPQPLVPIPSDRPAPETVPPPQPSSP
jgi:hypothetical protein